MYNKSWFVQLFMNLNVHSYLCIAEPQRIRGREALNRKYPKVGAYKHDK